MPELIGQARYWARRLREAQEGQLHHSIFKCPLDRWRRIEDKHREIILSTILANESVLDAGCGYGRLLGLIYPNWQGRYHGFDLSPDFIALAREIRPGREFAVGLMEEYPLTFPPKMYDWGVLISIRPMVKRHQGEEAWNRMETALRHACDKLLYLEYDETDQGSVE